MTSKGNRFDTKKRMTQLTDCLKIGTGVQIVKLSLQVVEGNGPALLGRNWLRTIKLDWRTILIVPKKVTTDRETVINQHK